MDSSTSIYIPAQCSAPLNDWDCCTKEHPCGPGRGDCDPESPDVCLPGLLCGKDNCQSFDPAWSGDAFDCCYERKFANEKCTFSSTFCVSEKYEIPYHILYYYFLANCTNETKCTIGEGPCESDSDCVQGATCVDDIAFCREYHASFPNNTKCCYAG